MNIYNVEDNNFKNSNLYQGFLDANPGRGSLKVRAYAASQAIPVAGVRIVISKNIEGSEVIFFDGLTDPSGIVEKISLPTPKLETDNLTAPKKATYEVQATYEPDGVDKKYSINMYDGICVVQNIDIIPSSGDNLGV